MSSSLKQLCLSEVKQQRELFGEIIAYVNLHKMALKQYLRQDNRLFHLKELRTLWNRSKKIVDDYFAMNEHYACFHTIPDDELRVIWTYYIELGMRVQTKLLVLYF